MYLFFFKLFSHIGYYNILSRVLPAIQKIFVDYLFYMYVFNCSVMSNSF